MPRSSARAAGTGSERSGSGSGCSTVAGPRRLRSHPRFSLASGDSSSTGGGAGAPARSQPRAAASERQSVQTETRRTPFVNSSTCSPSNSVRPQTPHWRVMPILAT